MSEVSINVSSQNVQFRQNDNLSADQQKQIGTGNFGTVQNLTVVDGKLSVTTDLGTFTVTGPKLQELRGQISPGDCIHARQSLESLKGNVKMDIYIMMELFHKIGNEMKQEAREGRQAARDLRMESLQSAADQMRTAAGKACAAACISGGFQIGSGVMSVGSGLLSIGGGLAGAKGGKIGTDAAIAQWGGYGKALGGAGELLKAIDGVAGGGGGIWSALVQRESKEFEAKQKESESAATKAESQVQMENEMMQDMRDLIKKVQDQLQAMEQARSETAKNILRA